MALEFQFPSSLPFSLPFGAALAGTRFKIRNLCPVYFAILCKEGVLFDCGQFHPAVLDLFSLKAAVLFGWSEWSICVLKFQMVKQTRS